MARPPTSAVDGRSVTPARRTAGLLFILAASTRALRPTVLTVASRFSRAVFVCVGVLARDVLTVRWDDESRGDRLQPHPN